MNSSFVERTATDELLDAELSSEYPDDEYRFLASRYVDDGVLTFIEAETSNPEAVIRFIDEDLEIGSHEVTDVSWMSGIHRPLDDSLNPGFERRDATRGDRGLCVGDWRVRGQWRSATRGRKSGEQ